MNSIPAGVTHDVRFGLLGCGRIGLARADALKEVQGAQLAAVADAEPERAHVVASEVGARVHRDADELLASEVDAVIVAVPTYLHAPLTIQAADAGKHVLCEKPMAMTVAEADEMIRAATPPGRRPCRGRPRRPRPGGDRRARARRRRNGRYACRKAIDRETHAVAFRDEAVGGEHG